MRHTMIQGLALVLLTSFGTTNNKNLITGDLFFTFFRIGTYYNLPDSVIEKFENDLNVADRDTPNSNMKGLGPDYRRLKDEGLIYKPFVHINVNDELAIILVLDSADYDKIKKYKYKDLIDSNKKVRIKAMTRKTGLGFYYCTDLLEVKLVKGQTFPEDNKERNLDYN